MKRIVRTPFFVVNPKAYLYGEGSLALALEADRLAAEYDVDIFFTAQACDLSMIAKATKHLIVTAQHIDGILPGRGMGSVLPEAVKNAGAEATFLNHAEHSLSAGQLVNAVRRAKELDIIVLVCADSPEEARAIAELHPDIMICEPTSLIGSGNASDSEYKRQTNDSVRAVSRIRWLFRRPASARTGMFTTRSSPAPTARGRPAGLSRLRTRSLP